MQIFKILFSRTKIINIVISILTLVLFLTKPIKIFAIYDPLTVANNKVGIHILDMAEANQAAMLVNGNGGKWGYVTLPIRSDQRNRQLWNNFFHKLSELKLIPIIRLATEMTPKGWAKPTKYTSLDFANFLNDLDWPIQNRYIIFYNEPNHATEWGGEVNPEEYADELNSAIEIFKSRSDNFFILPAGLDVAAPNDNSHMRWSDFISRMYNHNSNALKNIDGWNSHSYPNPAFSGEPSDKHDHSIISYQYEKKLIESLINKSLPIFITETGWSNQKLKNSVIADYYTQAFNQQWNDSQIVAITPFVLYAGAGPFAKFSLLNDNNSPTPQYLAIQKFANIVGEPPIDYNQNINNNKIVINNYEIKKKSKNIFKLDLYKWLELFNWIKK